MIMKDDESLKIALVMLLQGIELANHEKMLTQQREIMRGDYDRV